MDGRENELRNKEAAAAAALGVAVVENADGAKLTSYRGGGRIAKLYVPDSVKVFGALYSALVQSSGDEVFVLGGGSDTLVDDGVVQRPVILTRGMRRVAVCEDGTVYAECGATLGEVAATAARAGYGGLEFLAGVPATVGGALAMNAGAFGAEIADYVAEVHILNPYSGDMRRRERGEISFGHRKGVRGTVAAARFSLPRMSGEEIAERRRFFLSERRKKQPAAPSLGSVFTGEAGAAGRYIDAAGLKGVRAGGAQISPVHANFIVNVGGGSAGDYRFLARLAKETVKDLYGICLTPEVVLLGDGRDGVAD